MALSCWYTDGVDCNIPAEDRPEKCKSCGFNPDVGGRKPSPKINNDELKRRLRIAIQENMCLVIVIDGLKAEIRELRRDLRALKKAERSKAIEH